MQVTEVLNEATCLTTSLELLEKANQ